MRPVEKDSPDHMITLPDHPDFGRCLDEVDRFERIEQLAWNAARPAARLRRERHLALAAEQLLVGLLHLLLCPWLQDRILAVGDADRGLLADAVGFRIAEIGIGGIVADRPVTGTRRRILPILEVRLPAKFG